MKVPDDGLPINRHSIVVGQTGVGKSNTVMIGIMQRLLAGQQVHIVDSKRELGQIFDKHAKIYTMDQASALIRSLVKTGEERAIMFDQVAKSMKEPCRDIWEYTELTGQTLPIISVVVEELIMLIEYLDVDTITNLLVAGRSSGIFVFAVAQYLNATLLPKLASSNFQTKIFLGPPDQYALKALFPNGIPTHVMNDATAELGPAGIALCFIDNKFDIRQLPRVSKELLRQWM